MFNRGLNHEIAVVIVGRLSSDYDKQINATCELIRRRPMPITISYDLANADTSQRNYVRSMLERFAWERLGGSVFRYSGRVKNKKREEDWFNDVVPALMFFRSYVLKHGIEVKFFTLDTNSIARIDFSDAGATLGNQPFEGKNLESVQELKFRPIIAPCKHF